MKIDITTTATLRPHLLNRTLDSFKSIFKYIDNFIINIDPIGDNFKVDDVLDVAFKYFKNVKIRKAEIPSFSSAVIWCWSNIISDYCFHLEDDWILLKNIDIEKMVEILESNNSLVSLRLNKEKTPNNGEIEFVFHEKLSLNPTLFKSSFLKEIACCMDPNLNPEKQLRTNAPGRRGEILKDVTHGIYIYNGFDKIVSDIGRQWMKNSKYIKKTGFMEWEVKL